MSKYLVKKQATVYEINSPLIKKGVDININDLRKHTFKVGEIIDSEMRSTDGGYSYSKTPTVFVDGVEYGTQFISRWAEPLEPENPLYNAAWKVNPNEAKSIDSTKKTTEVPTKSFFTTKHVVFGLFVGVVIVGLLNWKKIIGK